ncbi:hypothetical protein Tco_1324144 [Tanacetum coccineum]
MAVFFLNCRKNPIASGCESEKDGNEGCFEKGLKLMKIDKYKGTCVQNLFGLMVPALLRYKTRILSTSNRISIPEATKVRVVEGLEAKKEAMGKKSDESAISGDRGTYAPEFNQLHVDMMTTITMHKAH